MKRFTLAALLLVLVVGMVHGAEPTTPPAPDYSKMSRAELEAECARLAAQLKIREAEVARLKAQLEPAKPTEKAAAPEQYFLGMLGVYSKANGPTAYINLRTPNGENVFDDGAKIKLKGMSGLSFSAKARLVVPVDGVYRVEAGRACELTIGDEKYGAKELDNYGKRNAADFPLKRGTYAITLTVGDNGSQMREAFVQVSDRASGKPLPIIISQTEIDEFTKAMESGEKRILVGDFDKNVNRVRVALP